MNKRWIQRDKYVLRPKRPKRAVMNSEWWMEKLERYKLANTEKGEKKDRSTTFLIASNGERQRDSCALVKVGREKIQKVDEWKRNGQ